jgi:hypothetical protein
LPNGFIFGNPGVSVYPNLRKFNFYAAAVLSETDFRSVIVAQNSVSSKPLVR